uniref:G-protein coupled receptors family 1 profile domain-containing protein n=1 Tax=Trichogramma kaykai TaxID=54128 RepID=A0ABD2WSU4_9HYME
MFSGLVVIFSYSLMGRTLCTRRPPFDCGNAERSISYQQGTRILRERRRLAWILLLLAILFALCWLPYHLLRLLLDFGVIAKPFHHSQAEDALVAQTCEKIIAQITSQLFQHSIQFLIKVNLKSFFVLELRKSCLQTLSSSQNKSSLKLLTT